MVAMWWRRRLAGEAVEWIDDVRIGWVVMYIPRIRVMGTTIDQFNSNISPCVASIQPSSVNGTEYTVTQCKE